MMNSIITWKSRQKNFHRHTILYLINYILYNKILFMFKTKIVENFEKKVQLQRCISTQHIYFEVNVFSEIFRI